VERKFSSFFNNFEAIWVVRDTAQISCRHMGPWRVTDELIQMVQYLSEFWSAFPLLSRLLLRTRQLKQDWGAARESGGGCIAESVFWHAMRVEQSGDLYSNLVTNHPMPTSSLGVLICMYVSSSFTAKFRTIGRNRKKTHTGGVQIVNYRANSRRVDPVLT
jgi:hypothetical protein